MKTLLIIPAYNEEDSIVSTVKDVINSGYDYIVINDGSTDKTSNILEQHHYNHVNLISNLGIGGAMQTGYKYAHDHGYDIAVQFDADGQHLTKEIDKLIAPIIAGKADFTIGSRFIDKNHSGFKSSALRRVGIRLLSYLIYSLSRKRIYDPTSGFRAASKDIIASFASDYPKEYPEPISDYELIKKHYKVTEVPVSMKERTGGKSSIHSWKSAYYVINVFISILIIALRRDK